MAISVAVPKDLSGIKTKVALNLTKRQIICFSGADYLFFGGSSLWCSGLPFYKGSYRDAGGSDCHGRGDASVFLFGNV